MRDLAACAAACIFHLVMLWRLSWAMYSSSGLQDRGLSLTIVHLCRDVCQKIGILSTDLHLIKAEEIWHRFYITLCIIKSSMCRDKL